MEMLSLIHSARNLCQSRTEEMSKYGGCGRLIDGAVAGLSALAQARPPVMANEVLKTPAKKDA